MRNTQAEIDNVLRSVTEHTIKSCLEVSNRNQWRPGTDQTVTQLCHTCIILRSEIKYANDKNAFENLPYFTLNSFLNIFNQWANIIYDLSLGNNNIDTFASITNELQAFWFEKNLSGKTPRLLNYEEKLGEVSRLQSELLEANRLLSEVQTQYSIALSNTVSIEQKIKTLESLQETIEGVLSSVQATQNDSLNSMAMIRQNLQSTIADSSTSKSKLLEIKETQSKIEIIRDSLDTFRERVASAFTLLDSISSKANDAIDTSNKRILAQNTRLIGLEKQIMSKLQLAVGETLFQAFEKRREEIENRFQIWRNSGLIIFSIGMIAIIVLSFFSKTYDVYFYLKLALIIPILSITAFCFNQYNKERRLAEEYAFKSAVSVSLEAYRDMVEKSIDLSEKEERARYTAFLTESVSTIFDPPTDRVFADRRTRGPSDLQIVKNSMEVIKPIIDTFKISH